MIDLCVTFSGPHLDLFAPLFFGTLARNVDPANYRLHVVLNRITREDARRLTGLAPSGSVLYTLPDRPLVLHGPDEIEVGGIFHNDAAFAADWMVEHCGGERWCGLVHFDVAFLADAVAGLSALIAPDVGLIGSHCPLLLVNRQAYRQCFMRFETLTDFYAVPIDDGKGEYKLRFGGDPRAAGSGALRLRGFDTGEMLELNVAARGWTVIPAASEIARCLEHVGGGSGYHGEAVNAEVKENAFALLRRHGIEP